MPKRRGGLDASAFMLCYHNVPISPGGVFWAPRRRAAHPRGAAASPGARQRGHRLLQRAAVNGSPLSGSYAGAKATIRFIASYAASESGRNALGIRFTSVLPQLTPETDLGAAGVAAYAARQGVGIPAFLDRLGPALTPEQVGTAIVDIATGAADDRDAYPAHRRRPQPGAVMPSSPLRRRPTTARGPEAGTVLTGTPEPSRAAPA